MTPLHMTHIINYQVPIGIGTQTKMAVRAFDGKIAYAWPFINDVFGKGFNEFIEVPTYVYSLNILN